MYFAALALFRAIPRFGNPLPRLVIAVLGLAFIPLGTHLGAAQQLGATAALIATMLLVELRPEARPSPDRLPLPVPAAPIRQDGPHERLPRRR